MEVKSIAKNTGIPARKMRLVVDMVRGKKVEDALKILKYAPTPHARIVEKVIKTAVSDAETVHNMVSANLKIVTITADEAMTLKRFKARSRHRVSPIKKRSSHITIVVGEQED